MPRKIRSMKKKRVRTNKRSVKRGGAGLRRTRTNKHSVKRGGNEGMLSRFGQAVKSSARALSSPFRGRRNTGRGVIVYNNSKATPRPRPRPVQNRLYAEINKDRGRSVTLQNQNTISEKEGTLNNSDDNKYSEINTSNNNSKSTQSRITPLEVQTYKIVNEPKTVYASINHCSNKEESKFKKYTRQDAHYDLKNCNNPDQKSSYLFRVNNENFVILSVYINQFERAFAHFKLYEEQGIYGNYPKLEVSKDEPIKLKTLLDACFEKIEGSNNWTNVREYITDLELLHIDPYEKYLSIPYSEA